MIVWRESWPEYTCPDTKAGHKMLEYGDGFGCFGCYAYIALTERVAWWDWHDAVPAIVHKVERNGGAAYVAATGF